MIKKCVLALVCSVPLLGCGSSGGDKDSQDSTDTGLLTSGDDRAAALSGAGIALLSDSAVDDYLGKQESALKQDLQGTGATVARDGDVLVVNFPGQITFAPNSAVIAPRFYDTLDEVSGTLNQYPSSYLDIIGNTDSKGSPDYNQTLSEERAMSVGNYFRSRGVAPARIVTYGQGESAPIADNGTEAGRQANRRVELRITPATN
ncbi:OmpA family protein [Rhodobacteraceae bacterium NNCM2]|nr:OmpA family protein [Coraliihabitans acroporae]